MTIDVCDVAKHCNKMVAVTSRVYGFKEFANMMLVKLGGEYPEQQLTLILCDGAKSFSKSL